MAENEDRIDVDVKKLLQQRKSEQAELKRLHREVNNLKEQNKLLNQRKIQYTELERGMRSDATKIAEYRRCNNNLVRNKEDLLKAMGDLHEENKRLRQQKSADPAGTDAPDSEKMTRLQVQELLKEKDEQIQDREDELETLNRRCDDLLNQQKPPVQVNSTPGKLLDCLDTKTIGILALWAFSLFLLHWRTILGLCGLSEFFAPGLPRY